MLWFKFYNTSTGRWVYLNLVNHGVSIGPKDAHIFPVRDQAGETYIVRGQDVERLMKIMDYQAEKFMPVNFGEPANG